MYFYSFEVQDRGSEKQFQVGGNMDDTLNILTVFICRSLCVTTLRELRELYQGGLQLEKL